MKRFKSPADIKVGTIGYGGAFNMGRAHLREMVKAGMTPVAVAEIDPARLEVAKTEFPGIATYTSVAEMLKRSAVDVLAIITPHNTHAALTIQCLRAGKAVVSEKPFAITTAECDRMIREAHQRGLLLSTYHNRHWDGCILNAVKRIGSGAIGEIVRIEAHMGHWGKPGDWWRSSKSISGGIMYDWGVHLLEYSLQLVQSDMVEVSGFARTGFWADQTPWEKDCNEDEGFAVARFASGAWVTLSLSSVDSNPKRGWLEVTGTKGSYVFDGGTFEVITHEDGLAVSHRGRNPDSEGWRLYQNIADHLTQGAKLVITPEWARRPIHILDLAGQSAKQGRALKAKYP